MERERARGKERESAQSEDRRPRDQEKRRRMGEIVGKGRKEGRRPETGELLHTQQPGNDAIAALEGGGDGDDARERRRL